MAKGFSAEAFVPEMRRMREEGMSNHAIAQALGVAVKTIYTYIGPQPKGIRRKPVHGGQPLPYREATPEPKEEAPACLAVEDRVIILSGFVGKYDISPKNKRVEVIWLDGSRTKIKFDEFEALVDELNAIKRKMTDLKIENEMW